MKNIVFIGFMATGKTSVAKKVAEILRKKYVSTDKMIIEKSGKSIPKIFEENGESFFRKIEKEVVREVSNMCDTVIDCGGGVVLDKDNVKVLKENGIIFLLQATPETIFQRSLKEKGIRPLLGTNYSIKNIEELLSKRTPYYLEAADYVIDTTDKGVEEVANKVIEIIGGKIEYYNKKE
ncbi:MAG: shikimate kinase [Nitrososphaeria archaeon]|nr:shikimate kinase [Nitrososphaeria archaeon]